MWVLIGVFILFVFNLHTAFTDESPWLASFAFLAVVAGFFHLKHLLKRRKR